MQNTCPTLDFGGGGGGEGSRRESTILEIELWCSISWVGVEEAEGSSPPLKLSWDTWFHGWWQWWWHKGDQHPWNQAETRFHGWWWWKGHKGVHCPWNWAEMFNFVGGGSGGHKRESTTKTLQVGHPGMSKRIQVAVSTLSYQIGSNQHGKVGCHVVLWLLPCNC